MPGKPLDKLLSKLRDEGVVDASPEVLPDEAASRAHQISVVDPEGFLALIEMMRESNRYNWADETLRGIYDTVEQRKTVTEAQRKTVFNIRHSVKNWEDIEE